MLGRARAEASRIGRRQVEPGLRHDPAQPVGIVGDDAVDTGLDEPRHDLGVVDGPDDHAQAQPVRLLQIGGLQVLVEGLPDRATQMLDRRRRRGRAVIEIEPGKPRRRTGLAAPQGIEALSFDRGETGS